MRAWYVYWISVAVAAVLWIGVPLLTGRAGLGTLFTQPVWLAVMLAPLVVAGVNLILFRNSHEEVCRLEAKRHGWLRAMVGDGYSARTFALTGVALLVLVVLILVAVATGGL
jgi:hypothetical protein